MGDSVGLLLLLVVILVLYLAFSQQDPEPPKTRLEASAGTNRQPVTDNRPKLTPEELATQREQHERELNEGRLFEVEERARNLEAKLAQEKEAKRKSLDDATRRTHEEDERRRRLAARAAADSKFGREFLSYINAPVPSDIKRSMQAFLTGEFVGSDRSPLAYVGYRVGKTHGLPVKDRERRLEVCFRIDIPVELRRDYSTWAGPGSHARLNAMCQHIQMLAAMRRDRAGYEVAVNEWERDAEWIRRELRGLAEKFSRHGVTW